MSSALATQLEAAPQGTVTIETTLLDLVRAVSESTEDDGEVVSTILHMLRHGRVELCGSFKGEAIDRF